MQQLEQYLLGNKQALLLVSSDYTNHKMKIRTVTDENQWLLVSDNIRSKHRQQFLT